MTQPFQPDQSGVPMHEPHDYHETHDPNEALYESIMDSRHHIRAGSPHSKTLEDIQDSMEAVANAMHGFAELEPEEKAEKFEDVVGVVFDQHPGARENIMLIQQARAERNEEAIKELTEKQKAIYTDIKREIAFMLGYEIEDVDAQNSEYRKKLIARLDDIAAKGVDDEEEIMQELGFLEKDEETDQIRFAFPQDIFPPHIVEKWGLYQQSIKDHVYASQKFNRAISDNSDEIIQLDTIRRYAHNNLARSIQDFMNLQDWDFERCRKFVAKMVEKRFPTVETKESKVTSESVVGRLQAIRALGKSATFDH